MGTVCKGADKNVVACLNLEFLNYFVQIIETYAEKQMMLFLNKLNKISGSAEVCQFTPSSCIMYGT